MNDDKMKGQKKQAEGNIQEAWGDTKQNVQDAFDGDNNQDNRE